MRTILVEPEAKSNLLDGLRSESRQALITLIGGETNHAFVELEPTDQFPITHYGTPKVAVFSLILNCVSWLPPYDACGVPHGKRTDSEATNRKYMSEQNPDPELHAMQQVIKALESLDSDARTRVLAYVFQRLGLSLAVSNTTPLPPEMQQPPAVPASPTVPMHTAVVTDIRSLKEAKQPKSDNQMATLVAYYLKEAAPAHDRKDTISQEDIEKYFKQAGFPLPNRPSMTLVNAKNAGYFDQSGVGLYKLNPVGHNLVAHGMPSSSGDNNRRIKKPKTKKAAK